MHFKAVLAIIKESTDEGCDVYGLAEKIARVTEENTREEIAAFVDAIGLGSIAAAVRSNDFAALTAAIDAEKKRLLDDTATTR